MLGAAEFLFEQCGVPESAEEQIIAIESVGGAAEEGESLLKLTGGAEPAAQ